MAARQQLWLAAQAILFCCGTLIVSFILFLSLPDLGGRLTEELSVIKHCQSLSSTMPETAGGPEPTSLNAMMRNL